MPSPSRPLGRPRLDRTPATIPMPGRPFQPPPLPPRGRSRTFDVTTDAAARRRRHPMWRADSGDRRRTSRVDPACRPTAVGAQVSALVGLVAASLEPGSEGPTVIGACTSLLFSAVATHRSGSRGALLRPGPLRTVLANLTAHGSSKPVRVGRLVVIRPALQRPSVRSPPKRRPTCPRVLTPHRLRHLAHLTLSAPFRVGHKPVSGQFSADRAGAGRRPDGLRFPVASRRTGVRFWVILSR
jgi:hypothetical protein